MGKHEYSNIIEECPICYTDKEMLILKCKHKICNYCWYRITDIAYNNYNERYFTPKCPICRNINDWGKQEQYV